MNIRMLDQGKRSLRLKLIIGAFLLLLILIAAPANAAPLARPSGTCGGSGTVICIDPATQSIGPNQVTTVDIRIDNIPVTPDDKSLFGADVRLSFSQFILCAQDGGHPCPNASNAVTVTPGPLLTQTDAFCSSNCYSIFANNVDNTAGTIKFILFRLNPAHSISGSGVLATITFYGLAGPASPIHFTLANLSDRNGSPIPATTQDGVINVSGPTAVTLSSFKLDEPNTNNERVSLAWTTASEIKTAGFNVYRGEKSEGPFRRINPVLIPASGDSLLGKTYHYADADIEPGKTYYYQLEDVEQNGTTTRHNSIAVTAPSPPFWNFTSSSILLLSLAISFLGIGRFWRNKYGKLTN